MKFYLFFTLCLLLAACKQSLEKVPYEEYLKLVNERQLTDLSDIKKMDPNGNEISQDSLTLLYRKMDLQDELFKNKQGEIVEIHYKPKPALREIKINCREINLQLDSIYRIDQANRQAYDPKTDYSNLEFVVNVIDQCGMPESSKNIKTIFLVVQHNHSIYQKRYIQQFKAAAQNGKLNRSSLAMMEDRILLNDGKPQIYGSQLTRKTGETKWKLHDLMEPERVNIRRAEVGLEPIEAYLERYGIEFKVAQVK